METPDNVPSGSVMLHMDMTQLTYEHLRDWLVFFSRARDYCREGSDNADEAEAVNNLVFQGVVAARKSDFAEMQKNCWDFGHILERHAIGRIIRTETVLRAFFATALEKGQSVENVEQLEKINAIVATIFTQIPATFIVDLQNKIVELKAL